MTTFKQWKQKRAEFRNLSSMSLPLISRKKEHESTSTTEVQIAPNYLHFSSFQGTDPPEWGVR